MTSQVIRVWTDDVMSYCTYQEKGEWTSLSSYPYPSIPHISVPLNPSPPGTVHALDSAHDVAYGIAHLDLPPWLWLIISSLQSHSEPSQTLFYDLGSASATYHPWEPYQSPPELNRSLNNSIYCLLVTSLYQVSMTVPGNKVMESSWNLMILPLVFQSVPLSPHLIVIKPIVPFWHPLRLHLSGERYQLPNEEKFSKRSILDSPKRKMPSLVSSLSKWVKSSQRV